MVLETAVQLERDPLESETSDSTKFDEASESVKVRVAVSPVLRDETSEPMEILGLKVSTDRVSALSESAPSWLLFPAKSQKTPESTEIKASVVLLLVGVNVAVYDLEESAIQLESDPPESDTSDSTKSDDGSESVKVSVAISPACRDEMSDVRAMVGLTVSTEKVTELSGSAPSILGMPAESEKTPEATEITPSVVLSESGVKIAV